MTVASLDEISEGRVILGIGTSGKNVVEGFHGREFKKPLSQWKDVLKVVREGLMIGGVELFGLGGDEIKAYLPAAMTVLRSRPS